MRRTETFLVLTLAIVCSTGANGWADKREKPPGLTPPNAVACYDPRSEKFRGSQSSRSHVCVSPDGKYRAFVDNKAIAYDPPISGMLKYAPVHCANTSRLFVAGPGKRPFQVVYVEEPTTKMLGNSIRIVDWSPDSRFLLLMVWTWQYSSDFGGGTIRIYDAYSGVLTEEEMLLKGLRSPTGRTCSEDSEALGFSTDGHVVFRIWPTYEDGGNEPDVDSCVQKPVLRLLNFRERAIALLPDDYRVVRYGRQEAQAAK